MLFCYSPSLFNCLHITPFSRKSSFIRMQAGNLRFCPEFLCFLFHKMSATLRTVIEGNTPGITVGDRISSPLPSSLVMRSMPRQFLVATAIRKGSSMLNL